MDSERLGIELGHIICDMVGESIEEIDDIISTLGAIPPNFILFEYIALLLWTATKAASNVLPGKSFQHASDVAFSVVFDFLNTIEDLILQRHLRLKNAATYSRQINSHLTQLPSLFPHMATARTGYTMLR